MHLGRSRDHRRELVAMSIREFHNTLRVLLNIDMDALEDAGVIEVGDRRNWYEFRKDPFRWFITAPDAVADSLWALMQKRG